MASVSEKSHEFIYTWSIHNFSHLALEEEETVESSKFVVEFMKDSEFLLQLCTKDHPGFVGCFLYQIKGDPTFFLFQISVCNSKGEFVEVIEMRQFYLPLGGNCKALCINELCNYLENDTLTFRCRILENANDIFKSVMCYAHTEVKVLNLNYLWTLDDILESNHAFKYEINETTDILTYSSFLPAFRVKFLNGLMNESYEDDAIHFAIESLEDSRTFFLVFAVHLLDVNGSRSHTLGGRYLFEKSTTKQILDLPFVSKTKLLSNEELYLPSGKLNIQCQFSISTNDVEKKISSVSCRSCDSIQAKTPPKSVSPSSGYELWKENAQKFLAEGGCSDFVIRSADKDFPVHKSILAAQSKVFCAMFEHDMQERNTGVVKMDDIENGVISKLLTYIYTNTLEDIDGPTAKKLYLAADMHGVIALRRICSSYLQAQIDASNVCELLVLADTHQDTELKSSVEDFIFENARGIIDSEDWKKTMKTHALLTSETMQRMFCEKILKDLKP